MQVLIGPPLAGLKFYYIDSCVKLGKTTKTEIVKCRVAMVAPCLQGGPRLVAHRLRWGPRSDPCTEHTMNRCEPCAIKQKRTGAAEGLWARVLSKKAPPSCTSKVLPPIEGVGTFTGNGPPAVVPRNRVITVLGTCSTAKLTIYLSDAFLSKSLRKTP